MAYCDSKIDLLNCILMKSASFEAFLEQMKAHGYEIRTGTYLAVRPKDGEWFIRFKSLGTEYSEMALKRRLRNKLKYEQNLTERVLLAKQKVSSEKIVLLTERYYIIQFSKNLLPMHRRDEQQPFSWKNDAELDRILAFNHALNQGETLESIRRAMSGLEQKAADAAKEEKQAEANLRLSYKLRECIGVVYEDKPSETYTRAVAESELRNFPSITRSTYRNVGRLVEDGEREVREAAAMSEIRRQRKLTDGSLTRFRTDIFQAVRIAAECITQAMDPHTILYDFRRDDNEKAERTGIAARKADIDCMGADSAPQGHD